MAYKMRPRNQRVNYDERADFSASGDESHDSTHSQANIDVNTPGAAADQMQQHGDGADASSSRNIGVTGRTSARRRPQVRRRRRRTNLVQNPVTIGEVPVPEPEPDNKTILSWLTDKGILPEGQEGGVRCRCCEQVFNVYEFVDWSDESDDACMICADGGDLICCDTCPSTFHYSCMGMQCRVVYCLYHLCFWELLDFELQNIPKEDWHCYYCLCKYCLIPSGTVESCMQCEKKYHSKCQEERNILVLRNRSSFCDTTCANIYNGLKNMLGVRNELDDGLSWSLLQQMQVMEPV
ncbi:hypothetical protein ACOSQ2_025685 [Xanthoceras sorbifolium]